MPMNVGKDRAVGAAVSRLVKLVLIASLAGATSSAHAGWFLGGFRGTNLPLAPRTVFASPGELCAAVAALSVSATITYAFGSVSMRSDGTGGSCIGFEVPSGSGPWHYGGFVYVIPCPPGTTLDWDRGSCTCSDPSLTYSREGAACIPPGPFYQAEPYTSLNRLNLGCPRETEGQPLCGQPINPAFANKFLTEVDYSASGDGGLRFARHYNSAGAASVTMGAHWLHEYERHLRPGTPLSAVRADGKMLRFTFDSATNAYGSDPNVKDRLLRATDGAGNLAGYRLHLHATDAVEDYDLDGRLTQITSRQGLQQVFVYSSASTLPSVAPRPGLLLRVSDPFGRELKLTYDALGRLATMVDPSGAEHRYAYDASGNLVSVTRPDASVRTYHYNEAAMTGGATLPNSLTGITDERGTRYSEYRYESGFYAGRAIETSLAGGVSRYTIAYEGTASQQVTDPRGVTRTYSYQPVFGENLNRAIVGPPCTHCSRGGSRTFDTNGNLASSIDWNGNRTERMFDPARNLETLRVDAAGTAQERRITTEWHAFYQLPLRMAEPLRITTYTYGDPDDPNLGNRGSVLSKTMQATSDAGGTQGFGAAPVGTPRSWTYTYNLNGQVLSADGPRTDVADVTTYTYYPNTDPDLGKRGNVATITSAAGHVTEIAAYDVRGMPLTIVDPNGLVTTLAYDVRQRLTSRAVGGELTSYEYDGVGQLTKVTLPDGSFLIYSYDAARRLTAIADSLGNRIAYTLDAVGNRTSEQVFDPANQLAQARSRVYSNLNRLEQEIGGTSPTSQITRFAYDNQGNVTQITDPLSRVTASTYDALNRLKQMTDPASGVTRYGYDGSDQLTSVTDPRNNGTSYTLDGLGNLLGQSSPDTGNTANTQDAAGNLLTSTDAKGQTASYSYDALNRVTRIVYGQAAGNQLKQVDFHYDQGTNGIGRLSSITETSAAGAVLQTTAYGYDQRGRVTSEARTIGGTTHTAGYSYDAAGRMTGVIYPSGRTVAYGLDGLGRVSRIETTGGGTTQVVVQDVAYQPFGSAKSFTFGNLQTHARAFDLDGRIAAHSLAAQTKTLSFDAASRITRIEQQGLPTNFADYGYDALDRLTSTVLPTSTFTFGYDAVGNRVFKSAGAGSDTYTYPATSNRLAAIAGSSARSYAHDANGAITDDGVRGFGYDARGRLVSSTSAAGSASYQVNALGQRVRKTSSFGDTIFHYDGQGRLLAESSPSGAPIREYLWLGDQPVAVAAYSQAAGGCPANPVLDSSNTFAAFARRERMEVHGGRPGEKGWEWGLGTNTRNFAASARADLDWVSGKPYGFVLTYDGAGNAQVTVRDGASELFTLNWSGEMDVGNALKFIVRSPAGIGAGNRISVAITRIDGQPVPEVLATAGDDGLSEVARVYAGSSLQNGYSVEGTVTFSFTGNYPPRGNRLDFTVTAGSVTCQGQAQASAPVLYYVLTDHLNTPRIVTDSQQRVVWRWENQEPFGNSPPEENPSGLGNFEFPLRFAGQYFDKETGLSYNGARDYDPATARYAQSDPTGLQGGINTYGYANQNPLSFIDPTGEVFFVPLFGFGAATVSADAALLGGIGLALSQASKPSSTGGELPRGNPDAEPGAEWTALGLVLGRGRYYCRVGCNVYPIEGCPTCPNRVAGFGYGRTPDEAWENAKASANAGVPRSCGYRHCEGKEGSCKGRKR